jgi:hypothetical protein
MAEIVGDHLSQHLRDWGIEQVSPIRGRHQRIVAAFRGANNLRVDTRAGDVARVTV